MTTLSLVLLILLGVEILACLGLSLWLFSLPGTRGAFSWGIRSPFYGVWVAGILPWLIFAVGEALDVEILSRISFGLACVSIFLDTAIFIFVQINAGAREKPGPIELLNPIDGIGAKDGRLRIAFSSDPHVDAPNTSSEATGRIVRTIADGGFSAFFMLGDAVELGTYAEAWNMASTILAVPGTPVRPLLGNHDALVAGTGHFRRVFFPDSFASDSGSPYYYSVQAPGIRFLVLNLLWGSESFDAAQKAWLVEALSRRREDEFTVVLSHCFFYASGYRTKGGYPWYDHRDTIPDIVPLLASGGVDLVISGHNHYMEYLSHEGIAYAVVGSMGGLLDPVPAHVSEASVWLGQGRFGFLELELIGESATQSIRRLQVVFRDPDGAELYSTEIRR